MDGEAALRERMARIEAAMGATARALEAARSRMGVDGALDAVQAQLDEAHARIAELETDAEARATATSEVEDRLSAAEARAEAAEAALSERSAAASTTAEGDPAEETVRLREAVEALTATSEELRMQAPGATDRALEAEVEALRAARAMDLKDMEALLAELEPLLEARPDPNPESENA